MNMIPIFALMLAPNPPVPINEAQMRDIGCVATIGIIANEQRTGQELPETFPDLRESGKRWAGMVGARVMEESGQPREVVAFAIQQSVEAEQARVIEMNDAKDPMDYVRGRVKLCKAFMDAQLAAADAATPVAPTDNSPTMLALEPAPKTDEPDKIAQYRTQLGEDLGNPHRIRYCKTLVDISYKEITDREGADSRDAKAFGRLAQAFAFRAQGLSPAEKPKPISAEELQTELEKEPSNEEKMARCLRLGESLALAMPPE
ncbi:hypothetical protein DXH95_01045 [Sphingorhabdus pulchriflava]|uniref:Uncharacterized protein n=1 Tax=Sphingorhabdus pulchriflava TaxID=2292257 RepID=A0A371BEN4_9SPHN|nr:hypothetical protein [Sphingorhabdus pulchriflava]RDV06065.1 hypothetical protein DXH95_01045 [Sphingorhabdus pulchriflava]